MHLPAKNEEEDDQDRDDQEGDPPPDGLPPPPPSLPRGMMEAVPLMQGATVRCLSIIMPGHVSARAASLDALAAELTNALGRPVVNRTGLTIVADMELLRPNEQIDRAAAGEFAQRCDLDFYPRRTDPHDRLAAIAGFQAPA